jgi:hypothetical protein
MGRFFFTLNLFQVLCVFQSVFLFFFEAISSFQHSLFLPEKGKKELKQMLQSGLNLFEVLIIIE